jgi:hypothetical protein
MTPFHYHPRPERWPQVSLRGLLVVVTLSALVMPWAVAEYRAWRLRGTDIMRGVLDDCVPMPAGPIEPVDFSWMDDPNWLNRP